MTKLPFLNKWTGKTMEDDDGFQFLPSSSIHKHRNQSDKIKGDMASSSTSAIIICSSRSITNTRICNSEWPRSSPRFPRLTRLRALEEKTKPPSSSAEDVTKKYGLEAGLWKIFNSPAPSSEESEGTEKSATKGKGEQAKELLAKYGGAYLATSITLSLISFTLCYVLVSAGIDVSALLNNLGISTDETAEKVGTFALAYAAHKAASPIRFPPTVALTPIVASWFNNKTTTTTDKEQT